MRAGTGRSSDFEPPKNQKEPCSASSPTSPSTAAASAVPALSPTRNPSPDVKTLSPCNKYAEHRDGKPNAVVNDRQRQVDKDYHHRAKELDSGF